MREQLGCYQATKVGYQNSKHPLGAKTGKPRIYVCDHCGEKFNHYYGEIYYKHKGKLFCSYKCKRAYLRETGVIE